MNKKKRRFYWSLENIKKLFVKEVQTEKNKIDSQSGEFFTRDANQANYLLSPFSINIEVVNAEIAKFFCTYYIFHQQKASLKKMYCGFYFSVQSFRN